MPQTQAKQKDELKFGDTLIQPSPDQSLDHDKIYDVVIVGAGVVGLGTAMYAGRLELDTVVFGTALGTELPIGGVLTLTDVVENYPGFIHLTGTELAKKLRDHALDYDEWVQIIDSRVTDIEKGGDCFRIHYSSGESIQSKTVIFATGARWRKLPMKGAEEFENKGVHYCALCDGPLYSDGKIAVIGGSDTAAKEALVLADIADKVYIIYRGEKIRPEPINGERVENTDNIEVINNTNVTEIKGNDFVNEIELDNPYQGNSILSVDAVFGAIGHEPNSELAGKLGVELNEKDEIKLNRDSSTNVDGVYAAGDVGDLHFKQAITGMAEGVIAAHSAFQYVTRGGFVCTFDDQEIS